MISIESPTVEAVDAIADLWVELASSQRRHGSHLLSEKNRRPARNAITRHVVTGGMLVATEYGPKGNEGRIERRGKTYVGFVMFDLESGAYEQDVTRGVIHNLYVQPGYRDEGVGTELLEAAEGALADRGAEVVTLEAMADNDAAKRFYRRHGYDTHRVTLEKGTETTNRP
jgi:ribosomal protein S18 acetylase RimI-like enzyme